MPKIETQKQGEGLAGASLLGALHLENPYVNFNPKGYRHDLEGWNSQRPIFHELLGRVRPRLVIEVGSWKGASAIHMGQWLKKAGSAATLLCIDTWLGSLDFWQDQNSKSRYRALNLKHGYPTVYYQFLYNVIHNRLTETIVPFPQTSLAAARWLEQRGIRAELIYIDASHLEQDVYEDIKKYYALLTEGGMIFGDDYYPESIGVRRAVDRFAFETGLAVSVREDQFWVIQRGSSCGA